MTRWGTVSHLGIGVRDFEVALPFYRDLLGMRVVVDREERFFSLSPGTGTEHVEVNRMGPLFGLSSLTEWTLFARRSCDW
jgi:catechol 2,3-dioxygenase-like lactoylglutathione lyase family enzyme